nr:transposase family protein [Streptomyces graminofaciens]
MRKGGFCGSPRPAAAPAARSWRPATRSCARDCASWSLPRWPTWGSSVWTRGPRNSRRSSRGFKASGGKRLSSPKEVVNRLVSSLRAPVEHGFASLKTFRILTKVRMHPRRATALMRALLVLTHHQVAR